MARRYEIYRCEVCGNIVEVLVGGVGKLVCCGQPMTLLSEAKEETGYEKHLPVAERAGDTLTVKVGSVPHPMEEKHYIQMVEVVTENGVLRRYLKPGDKPEAVFCTCRPEDRPVALREHCSIHGLWRSENVE